MFLIAGVVEWYEWSTWLMTFVYYAYQARITPSYKFLSQGLSVPALVKSTYDPIVASFAVGHIMNVPVSSSLIMLSLHHLRYFDY